jgi:anti-anti-sigma factor
VYVETATFFRKPSEQMHCVNDPSIVIEQLNPLPQPALATVTHDVFVLYVGDGLRAPITGELPHRVRDLLRHGERTIVLDLGAVSSIDATGVGQLVRAYNFAVAAECDLRIEHAAPRVREILERVGLFKLLSRRVESDSLQ